MTQLLMVVLALVLVCQQVVVVWGVKGSGVLCWTMDRHYKHP
jgi:hypothetical protein